MAAAPEAAALTEAHRAGQARIGALLAAIVLAQWRQLVRQDNVDASARGWLAVVMPLIMEWRRRSASLAAQYYASYALLEARVRAPEIRLAAEIPLEQLRTSLIVTGPVAFKAKVRAMPGPTEAKVAQALREAGIGSAAAAIRHTLDGGRDTIANASTADQRALGWVRVTRADPCYFCALLASRGPVYKGDTFDQSDARFEGEGHAKVHDKCGCSLEPVYSRAAPWPGRAREFEQLYRSSTAGQSDKINAFRRAYEGR